MYVSIVAILVSQKGISFSQKLSVLFGLKLLFLSLVWLNILFSR